MVRHIGRNGKEGGPKTAPSEWRSMANEARDDTTVLGRDARLEGDFAISGSIRIDGVFTGKISAENAVMLSEGSEVRADIEGETVAVAGRLWGNVVARGRAELGSTARVEGDITSNALVVAPGAVFIGRSVMPGDRSNR
jgi:cytoskeletal protein CcmA (bactofilin family)